MTPRSRTLSFGAAFAFAALGGVCAAFVDGVTGEVLTVALISIGLGGALLLVFLEVGLSEERELARDERRRRERNRRSLGIRKRSSSRPRSRR